MVQRSDGPEVAKPGSARRLLGWISWWLRGRGLARRAASGPVDQRLGAIQGLRREISPRAASALLALLADQVAEIRAGAARAVGGRRNQGDVHAVAGLLKDDRATVRGAAAEGLALLGDWQAVGRLLETLADRDADVRRATAGALGSLGQPEWGQWVKGDGGDFLRLGQGRDARALPVLVAALSDGRALSSDRQKAAEGLGELGDPDAVPALAASLSTARDPGIAAAAAEALGKLGDRQGVGPLVLALAEGVGAVRTAAAVALGRLGDSAAVEPLRRGVVHAEGEVRRAAARALGTLGEPQWELWVRGDAQDFIRLGQGRDPAVFDLLDAALGVPDRSDRMALISAVEALGDRRGARALSSILKSRTPSHRAAAIRVIGKLGSEAGVDDLVKLLDEDRDAEVRVAAAEALATLAGRDAIEPLITALGDPSGDVRRAAATGLALVGEGGWAKAVRGDAGDFARLGETRDPLAVGPLLRVVGTAKWEDRASAAQALGALGDARAVDGLVRLLREGDVRLLPGALSALAAIGDLRAAEAVRVHLGDPDAKVRTAAGLALEKLGEPWWRGLVSGKDSDIAHLGETGHVHAAAPLLLALSRARGAGSPAATSLRTWLCHVDANPAPGFVEPLISVLTLKEYSDRPIAELAELRRRAATVLGRLGDRRATPGLGAQFFAKDDALRAAVRQAVLVMGDPAAVAPIVQGLGSGAWANRKETAQFLVAFAGHHPGVLGGSSKAVRGVIESPHDDRGTHDDRHGVHDDTPHSSGGSGSQFWCNEHGDFIRHHDYRGHQDHGIGLKLPADSRDF